MPDGLWTDFPVVYSEPYIPELGKVTKGLIKRIENMLLEGVPPAQSLDWVLRKMPPYLSLSFRKEIRDHIHNGWIDLADWNPKTLTGGQ